MNHHLIKLAFAAVIIVACTPEETRDPEYNDLIRRVERSKAALICRTNEPFAMVAFNYYGEGTGAAPYGNGTVLFTYPDNTPPDFEGEERLKRVGGAFTEGSTVTEFQLSNGMIGRIQETQNGGCMDDMAGTLHNFRITIEKWSNNSDANFVKNGCCSAVEPSPKP